ncbi:MAG: hypothetical protein HQ464_14260 [Planctomycetes bacterium]|nr:hypothetical protein [Planctomycetota bacterium]
MNEQRNDASLHEILSAVCDETATAEQIERLAERLRSDAATRRFYVRYLDMHGRLNTLPALEDDAADANHAQRSRAWRRPVVWGSFAAAVAIAAFLLGGQMRKPADPALEQAGPAVRPYVATIIDASPTSLLNGKSATPGARLAPDRFHLTGGSCTLRFDGGAQLFFDDDARFAIVSRHAISIDKGAFAFRGDITCEAISITTPRSTLIDVGTEYAAVVKPGSEDLHVVDGMVRRTPSGGSTASELLPAKTGRSYAGREVGGRTIEFDPSLAARGTAGAATPSHAPVAPLAQDRFETDSPQIGQSAGGSGWKTPWVSHAGLPEFAIVRPGLAGDSSGAIAHAGGGTAAAHRRLASPIDLGTDGVWYVRYLVRRPAPQQNDPNIAMLVLRTYGLTTEEEIERQSALHLVVYRADTLAVKFAGHSVRSAVPQPPGETFAIVAKIVAGRTQPDQVFACVLPASRLREREPLEWAVATDCIASGHIYDQVSMEIVSQGEVFFDDIAIGTTWSSISSGEAATP